jgi:hypothetical protein
MRVCGLALLVMGAGCSGGEGSGVCTPLSSGAWTIDGPAMGMPMGATLTMDVEGCEFTFTEWSMEMLSLPIGGTVDAAAVQLDGDAHWSSCAGAVNAEGTEASGTCEDDGTDFTMIIGALTSG